MGDLALQLEVLRERLYLAAPLDDLDHLLHDAVLELAPLVEQARVQDRAAARVNDMDGVIEDYQTELTEAQRDYGTLRENLAAALGLSLVELLKTDDDELVRRVRESRQRGTP